VTAVISAPSVMEAFIRQTNDGSVVDVIAGAGRVYVLHRVRGRGVDQQFVDPVDGELLVESRWFETLPAALNWITVDIGLRNFAGEQVQ